MLTPIEDECGQPWFVGKGDPGHFEVQRLHSQFYTWIVLPRLWLTGQAKLHYAGEWKHALREARRMGYTTEGGKRHLRLAECLKTLEDN